MLGCGFDPEPPRLYSKETHRGRSGGKRQQPLQPGLGTSDSLQQLPTASQGLHTTPGVVSPQEEARRPFCRVLEVSEMLCSELQCVCVKLALERSL